MLIPSPYKKNVLNLGVTLKDAHKFLKCQPMSDILCKKNDKKLRLINIDLEGEN
jgi:hypothetical protein